MDFPSPCLSMQDEIAWKFLGVLGWPRRVVLITAVS